MNNPSDQHASVMFYQLGTILCSSHVITHLILETALLYKYYYHPQFFFTDEKKILRGEVPYSRSHHCYMAASGFKSGQAGRKAHAPHNPEPERRGFKPRTSAHQFCEFGD